MGYYINVDGFCRFKSAQALKDYEREVKSRIGPAEANYPMHRGKGRRGNGLTYNQLEAKGWATLEDFLWTHALSWRKVQGKRLTFTFYYDQKSIDFLRWEDCLRALTPYVSEAEWEYQGEEHSDRHRARIKDGQVQIAHSHWGEFH